MPQGNASGKKKKNGKIKKIRPRRSFGKRPPTPRLPKGTPGRQFAGLPPERTVEDQGNFKGDFAGGKGKKKSANPIEHGALQTGPRPPTRSTFGRRTALGGPAAAGDVASVFFSSSCLFYCANK